MPHTPAPPRARNLRIAATVSLVVPDREMATSNVCSASANTAGAKNANSEAGTARHTTPVCACMRAAAVIDR